MRTTCRLYFLLLLPIIFTAPVFSQQPHCYTEEKLIELSQRDSAAYQSIIDLQKQISQILPNARTNEDIYTIPVVVHIIYNSEQENLSDEIINSQIVVLNQDFMRLNADSANTPTPFDEVAANCNIQFCLASFDPFGDTTTGIIRTHTEIDTWSLTHSEEVKATITGGQDPWPPNSYLNIWVCNLQEGVLGYAVMPGIDGPLDNDGIVISSKFFGLRDISSSPYNLGRTATHEIGHWLGLFHTWGDDANTCEQDDGIDDTPLQQGENYGCADFPLVDECSPEAPGVMFMDYMDYSDDACMNLFTEGQKNRMRAVLETSRGSILNSPAGCNEIQPLPGQIAELILYPNPTSGYFTIAINNFKGTAGVMEVKVFDALGQLIDAKYPEPGNYVSAFFDLTNYAQGCYFVQAFNGTYFLSQEIMIW